VNEAHRPAGTTLAEGIGEQPWGTKLDRRRIGLQIRVALVSFAIEQRRPDSPVMKAVRARARGLLGELEEAVQPYPDLKEELAQARRRVEADEADEVDEA
jgi:hypothetical protein